MANPDPLAQLKDIHLPAPVSWWPLAPGWYVLIAVLLCSAIIIFYRLYRRHQHAKAKKYALTLLMNYQQHYEQEQNAAWASARISELLRRVALAYYPRTDVASLHGEAWLRFLNETGNNINFNLVRDQLLDAPFQSSHRMDLQPLFNTARLWIKQRSVPCLN